MWDLLEPIFEEKHIKTNRYHHIKVKSYIDNINKLNNKLDYYCGKFSYKITKLAQC